MMSVTVTHAAHYFAQAKQAMPSPNCPPGKTRSLPQLQPMLQNSYTNHYQNYHEHTATKLFVQPMYGSQAPLMFSVHSTVMIHVCATISTANNTQLINNPLICPCGTISWAGKQRHEFFWL